MDVVKWWVNFSPMLNFKKIFSAHFTSEDSRKCVGCLFDREGGISYEIGRVTGRLSSVIWYSGLAMRLGRGIYSGDVGVSAVEENLCFWWWNVIFIPSSLWRSVVLQSVIDQLTSLWACREMMPGLPRERLDLRLLWCMTCVLIALGVMSYFLDGGIAKSGSHFVSYNSYAGCDQNRAKLFVR